MTELSSLARRVASLRVQVDVAKDLIKQHEAALTDVPEYQALAAAKVSRDATGRDLEAAELDLRQALLQFYEQSGERKYGCGEIKLYTRLDYQPHDALAYCIEHKLNDLLELNKRGFEKVAKELKPEFVTLVDEPRAQIAGDLGEYLAEKAQEA